MLYLQRIVLLMFLLPAAAMAGESQPAATATKKHLDIRVFYANVSVYTAGAWYKAAVCSKRHKDLAVREKKIKSMVASRYPHFYKAVTIPPLSDWGNYLAYGTPFRPDADPTLTEFSCTMNLKFLKGIFTTNVEWKHALQKAWEGPHPLVKLKAPPPTK